MGIVLLVNKMYICIYHFNFVKHSDSNTLSIVHYEHTQVRDNSLAK